MKEPDHKVKRHVVLLSNKKKPYWIENPVHGWLGTGMSDRNGVEIFEGDRVKFGEHDNTGVIEFSNSMFIIQHDDSYRFTVLGNTAGFVDVEVVGHIAEEQQ